jgi:hypothetical protein
MRGLIGGDVSDHDADVDDSQKLDWQLGVCASARERQDFSAVREPSKGISIFVNMISSSSWISGATDLSLPKKCPAEASATRCQRTLIITWGILLRSAKCSSGLRRLQLRF